MFFCFKAIIIKNLLSDIVGAFMKYFSILSDTVFVLLSSFILSFLIYYYFLPRKSAISLAVFSAMFFSLLLFPFIKKKKDKRTLEKKEEQECEDVLLSLSAMPLQTSSNLVYKAYKSTVSCEKKGSRITFTDGSGTSVFMRFSVDGLTKTDVVKISHITKNNIIIASPYLSNEVENFIKNYDNITLLSGKNLYRFLKENDALPHLYLTRKKEQKIRLKNFIKRKHCIKYLLFGIWFTVLSFFLPVKTYYQIFGGIFILLAILSFFLGKEKEKS